MEREKEYTAVQTETGFHVVFHDGSTNPVDISFDEIQRFADKHNELAFTGKKAEYSDTEELIISLWGMLSIPDQTIH